MIDKKIHYCWFGGSDIPEKLQKCIESWHKFFPDYEFILWDESNFDVNICNYVRTAYEAKKWAFVSDYVRLYAVYTFGGLYLDTDVEVIRSFDKLLEYPAFMGFECSNKKNKEVNTGLGFGSIKGNPILKEMLDDYSNREFIFDDGTMDLTPCPQIQTAILAKHGLKLVDKFQVLENIVILPTDYLCAMNQYNGNINITENTYSIHHYFDSWNNDADKYRLELRKKFSKYGYFISNFISFYVSYCKYYGFFGMIKQIYKKIFNKF